MPSLHGVKGDRNSQILEQKELIIKDLLNRSYGHQFWDDASPCKLSEEADERKTLPHSPPFL